MNYATSRQVRRIVGRIAKGEPLIATLERLCRRENIRAGSIHAFGLLSQIKLQTYHAPTGYQPALEVTEQVELLGLRGNISTLAETVVLNCYCHVAAQHFGQLHVVGGQLADGTALSVEFVIEAFDDLVLERRLESRLGLPLLNRIETLTGDTTVDAAPVAAPPKPAPKPAPVAEPDDRLLDEDEPPANVAVSKPAAWASAPRPEPEPEEPPAPQPRAAAFTSEGASGAVSNPTILRLPSAPRPVEPPKPVAPPKPSDEDEEELLGDRKPATVVERPAQAPPKPEPTPYNKPEPTPAPPARPNNPQHRPVPQPERPITQATTRMAGVSMTPSRPEPPKPAPSQERREGLQERPSGLQDRPSGLQDRPSGLQDRPSGLQDRPSGLQDRPSGLQDRPSPSQERPAAPAEMTWGDAQRVSEEALRRQRLGMEPVLAQSATLPDGTTVSQRRKAIVEALKNEPDIKSGDLVEHPHFGRCTVLHVEEDEYIDVKGRGDKKSRLKLEALEITFQGTKDGVNLFSCKVIGR
jgi:predicted DNA-binding protein with PD1-like motif